MFIFSNTTTLQVHHVFCTYFFVVLARLRRESYLFHFFGGREHKKMTFFLFS